MFDNRIWMTAWNGDRADRTMRDATETIHDARTSKGMMRLAS